MTAILWALLHKPLQFLPEGGVALRPGVFDELDDDVPRRDVDHAAPHFLIGAQRVQVGATPTEEDDPAVGEATNDVPPFPQGVEGEDISPIDL